MNPQCRVAVQPQTNCGTVPVLREDLDLTLICCCKNAGIPQEAHLLNLVTPVKRHCPTTLEARLRRDFRPGNCQGQKHFKDNLSRIGSLPAPKEPQVIEKSCAQTTSIQSSNRVDTAAPSTTTRLLSSSNETGNNQDPMMPWPRAVVVAPSSISRPSDDDVASDPVHRSGIYDELRQRKTGQQLAVVAAARSADEEEILKKSTIDLQQAGKAKKGGAACLTQYILLFSFSVRS